MSKPMSDGGKGSVRRNEDNESYQNGWDRIFKRTKEEEQPMIDDDDIFFEDDDEDYTCPACNGSGEGMYDGSTCYKCEGTGGWLNNRDDDIGECYDLDD